MDILTNMSQVVKFPETAPFHVLCSAVVENASKNLKLTSEACSTLAVQYMKRLVNSPP